MSRLLALIVLIGLLAAGFYYWRQTDSGARAVATDSLGNVGERIGEVGQSVGSTLRDTKVTGQVKAALELNRTLQPYSFEVDTDHEVVILRGEVPTEELRLAAGQVAAAVPDVKEVRNEIRLGGAPAATEGGTRSVGESFDDRALEAKVNTAFSLNREMKGSDIKVSAFKREVTLTGTVASEAQKQRALAIARDTAGVAAVKDQISGSTASGPATATVSDRARAAQAALGANQSLAGYGLTVREERGSLLLAGRVRTAAEKDLAALLARDAAGMPVDNAVTIQP